MGILGTPATADAPKTPWKITGQLEEACSCSAACPCWFGSKATRMACGGGQFVLVGGSGLSVLTDIRDLLRNRPDFTIGGLSL